MDSATAPAPGTDHASIAAALGLGGTAPFGIAHGGLGVLTREVEYTDWEPVPPHECDDVILRASPSSRAPSSPSPAPQPAVGGGLDPPRDQQIIGTLMIASSSSASWSTCLSSFLASHIQITSRLARL